MSFLSRRSIIISSVAASLPIAVVAENANAALTSRALSENATLLTLGEKIAPLLEVYRTALARKRGALELAERLCPTLPNELVAEYFECTADNEKDLEGKIIWSSSSIGEDGKACGPSRQIFKADLIKKFLVSRSKREAKRERGLLKIAEKYEAGRELAIKQSGLSAADDDLHYATRNIENLAGEMRKIVPLTLQGISAKARVIAAYGEMLRDDPLRRFYFEGNTSAYELAEDFLRVQK